MPHNLPDILAERSEMQIKGDHQANRRERARIVDGTVKDRAPKLFSQFRMPGRRPGKPRKCRQLAKDPAQQRYCAKLWTVENTTNLAHSHKIFSWPVNGLENAIVIIQDVAAWSRGLEVEPIDVCRRRE